MNKEVSKKLKAPWTTDVDKRVWYSKHGNGFESLQNIQEKKKASVEKLVEVNQLKNWTKWTSVRKSQHKKLLKSTGRDPCNLLMNCDDKYRARKEEKEVIALASVMKNYEDEGIPGAKLLATQYFLKDFTDSKEKLRKGIIPEITYVGTPLVIKQELGIDCFQTSNDSEYKKERLNVLKDKIKIIQPHRPITSNLIIIGKKPIPKQEEYISIIPVITVSSDENLNEDISTLPKTLLEHIIALKIDNTLFVNEPVGYTATHLRNLMKESWHREKQNWKLTYATEPGQKCLKYVTLTNMGTKAISIYWSQVKETAKYVEDKQFQLVFFFDQNILTLIPGDSINMQFGFSSNSPISVIEKWELITYPVVNKSHKIILILDGLTRDNPQFGNTAENFSINIQQRVTNLIVEDILNEIIGTLKWDSSSGDYNEDGVSEEIIFNEKNPRYYYRQTIIERMKEIYRQVAGDCNSEWDLSVRTLRNLILKVELSEQAILYTKLRDCLSLLLTPKFKLSFELSPYVIFYGLLCKCINNFEDVSNNIFDTIAALGETKINYCFEESDPHLKPGMEHETLGALKNVPTSIQPFVSQSDSTTSQSSITFIKDYKALYRDLFYGAVHNLLCSTIDSICALLERHVSY